MVQFFQEHVIYVMILQSRYIEYTKLLTNDRSACIRYCGKVVIKETNLTETSILLGHYNIHALMFILNIRGRILVRIYTRLKLNPNCI